MREFSRPIVVVSKCIEFEPVRWNAQIISSEIVKKMKEFANFITICPEIGIGLGVPRETLRIVKEKESERLLQPATGLDFTEEMKEFSRSFLGSLQEVDGFILKSGSPSSAFKDAKIYPSIEKVAAIGKSPGFFGAEVLLRFKHLAIEDERRLLNIRIRQHFLTKLYTLSDFRRMKTSGSLRELIDFQSRNKLLFTAYSQAELHTMGKIVANQKNKSFQRTVEDYQHHLWKALEKPPSRGSNINVLTKAAGYFTKKLSKEEKTFFLDSINKYKAGKLQLSTPLSILRSWIIRFNENYLKAQTFFEPYPEALEQEELRPNEEKDYWK